MKRTIEFQGADVLDKSTLIIMLSDGSMFKLTVADVLRMKPQPLAISDKVN